MAKYQCPLCRVNFEGSVWDIYPQVIGHSDGSHKILYSQEDVFKIINEQAKPIPVVIPQEIEVTPDTTLIEEVEKVREQIEEVSGAPAEVELDIPDVTDVPPLLPTETVTPDLSPEAVAPSEAINPPPSPEKGSIGNLETRDQSIDAWWDKVLGKK